MTAPSTSNLDRAIGRLESGLESLTNKVEEISAKSKQALNEMRAPSTNLSALNEKMGDIDGRFSAVEPFTKEFNKWKERGVGAMILVALVAATLEISAAALVKKLFSLSS